MENGLQLSGGQRQRLGIDRVLDAETECLITATLNSLAGDVTILILDHRLVTVCHRDKEIYPADGRVAESGIFAEVRSQVPDFDRRAEFLGL